ncbi:MAG: hypothetical protein GY820_45410 [Gammaproteobacteria bacterium]|nr:hypothetical protein [Gammaproteobacteria bacterium]
MDNIWCARVFFHVVGCLPVVCPLSSYGLKRFLKSESQNSIAPYSSCDFHAIFIGLAGRGSAGHVDVNPARIGPRVVELWVETVFEI